MESSELAAAALELVAANQAGDLSLGGKLVVSSRRLWSAVRRLGAWVSAAKSVVAPCLVHLTQRERARFDDAALRGVVRRLVPAEVFERRNLDLVAHDLGRGLTAASLAEARPASWRSLVVHRCPGVDVTALAPTAAGLQRLSLRGAAASPEWERTVATVLSTLPRSLEALDVAVAELRRDATLGMATLGMAIVREIAKTHACLRELDISGWPGPGEAKAVTRGLALVAKRCCRVRWLRIAEYRDSALASVDDFPALESLDVSAVSRLALSHSRLVGWICKLGDLRYDGRVVVATVDAARRAFPMETRRTRPRPPPAARPAARQNRLHTLSLRGTVGGLVVPPLDRNVVSALVALDLTGADLDWEALLEIAPGMAQLRHLALPASGLDDARLCALLASELPAPRRLRHLDVSRNVALSYSTVTDLVKSHCPGLVVLRALGLGLAATNASAPSVLDVNKRPVRARSGRRACAADSAGARYRRRDAYHCATCLFVGDRVLCAHCATTCHAHHDLYYCGRIHMFCDCPTLSPRFHAGDRNLLDDDDDDDDDYYSRQITT